ncbi:putative photosynthetic complex assembly protein [Thiocystis violascens DSM 198]|uniref:Putative photosynthetic complex assembly protein n=1 Tax=Thiocystis violascens (strain ATCC 17096 / DSM 198 / 6111) TaxID=765911 RepID=U3GKY3_THIV6|nr:putative photosynthetic complex assembly protein [Thiocystis violascens DSM 198]
MSDALNNRPFPKGVLIAMAALLGFIILMISVARLTGTKMDLAPVTPEVLAREIKFLDLADGAVAVYDVETGALIQTLPPGEGGFIRGVLRSMERQRKGYQADLSEPFHLARRESGDLTLKDPITGIQLELKAYGATNEAAFEQLLPAPPAAPQ